MVGPMRFGHTLACLCLCACYAHHEVEFEELPEGCGIEPTFYEALDCPTSPQAVGAFAQVEVAHRVGVCCETGTSDHGVDHPRPDEWTITTTWTACECNELLDCLGPGETSVARIGPLVEGDNLVRAGERECVIRAEPAVACDPVPTEYIAPRVLFDDQQFSTSVIHTASADCGCAPRLSDDLDLELCGCGDACDAAFTTYGGSFIRDDRYEPGEHVVPIGDASHMLSVRELDPPLTPGAGCRPLEPTDLEFAFPADQHVGPRLIWAGVTGEQSLCCSPELLLAIRRVPIDRRAIELELYTCVFEDCLCGIAPPPTVETAWYDLGDLPSGEYTVRAGDLVRTLVVSD